MTSQENIHSFQRVQLKNYCFEIMKILSSLIKACIYNILGLVFGVFGGFITPAFSFILS